MPRPEPGKKYLIVFCKSCHKGFRVIDEPLFEGREHKVAGLGPKPERPFKSPHGF